MKASTILWGVGAFGVAALAVVLVRRQGAATATPDSTGEAERLAGVQHWYGQGTGQAGATQQAVAQEWAKLSSTFSTQPDFWV